MSEKAKSTKKPLPSTSNLKKSSGESAKSPRSKESGSKSQKSSRHGGIKIVVPPTTLSPEQEKLVDAFVGHAWDNQYNELLQLVPQIKENKVINALNVRGRVFVEEASAHHVGQSALYCACRNGHNKIVIELLNTSGVDVNVTATPHGGTPLHVAGSNGRGETVALLLAAGANPNSANTNGLEAKDDISNNEKIREIYNQFGKEPLLTFLLSWPILKELETVQREIKKDSEKRNKQQQIVDKQQKSQQGDQTGGFQLGKKQAEKVKINFAELSTQELEESINNIALPKSAYTFVNDTPDTGFLNYFNNPTFSALNAKKTAASDVPILSNDSNQVERSTSNTDNLTSLDQKLSERMNSLKYDGVKDVSNTNYSDFEEKGVVESFGFNSLFFVDGAFAVEKKEADDTMFGITVKSTPRSVPQSARTNQSSFRASTTSSGATTSRQK